MRVAIRPRFVLPALAVLLLAPAAASYGATPKLGGSCTRSQWGTRSAGFVCVQTGTARFVWGRLPESATTTPSAAIPATTASQPSATASPSSLRYTGPAPKAGTGALMGRLLWNGQGVAGDEVRLCAEVSLVTGCKGATYSATSASDGTYVLTDIPPGTYGLVAKAIDREAWLYVSTLAVSARTFTVKAGVGVNVGDMHLIKLDLQQTGPAQGASVTTATPTLSWTPYPSATSYKVYLTPDRGSAVYVNEETTAPSLAVRQPLRSCEYRWKVEAYNAQKVQIAEAADYSRFTVTGQGSSCRVTLTSPLGGTEVGGAGITLRWEAHPEATAYKLYMHKETGGTKVLDFVEVRATTYTIAKTLEPGTYWWTVYAYVGSDSVAASDTVKLIVR